MANTISNTAGAWTPADHGQLLIATAQAESVAMLTTRVVKTDSSEYRVPLVTEDVASGWYGELATIDIEDMQTGEEVVTPKKVAALSKLSKELATDSTPDAAQEVGRSIGRSIAAQIDSAFFGTGDGTGNAPKGLGALDDAALTTVDAGAAWANIDPFIDATYRVEAAGGSISAFIAHPNDAAILAKLKTEEGSNQPLLAPSANDSTRRAIAGVPLYVSRFAPEGVVYGIDRNRVHTVVRTYSEVTFDASRYFEEDAIGVRGVARVGFAYGHKATIARIKLSDGA